jgi:peroxiredoxin/predicted nucleic acid-binding Zn ribbon protein
MPQQRFCPNCGTQIELGQKYCSNCGATFCPVCSTLIPPGGTKCPRCNYLLGSASPGMAEHQPPTPPPSPMQFPSSKGGILGPQPGQPPSYPSTPPSPTPGAIPSTSIPQAVPPQQYGTGDQPPGTYVSPGATPYVSTQQPPVSTKKTFVDTGPIRVRRVHPALVTILIIVVIALPVFAAFKAGWLEGPLNAIQESVAGIQWLNWLPTSPKDTTPPEIAGVNVSDITQTGAVITWQTDEPATTQAMICNPSGGCVATELDENLVTNHSANISDLKPNITYHFSAISKDKSKNEAIAEGDFTTSAETGVTAPTISGIQVSNIADLHATISWVTDKAATSQVEYGITDAYGSTTPLDESLTNSHSTTLTGLAPTTTYHFKVKSKDASGNEVASQDQTFTTLSPVSAATEIGPEVGKLAPDFTLPTLDGTQISLSEFRGKIVIVNFWQDTGQCRNELSLMQTVYDKWPQDKLAILAISWKQTSALTQSVVNVKGLTFPIPLDETGEVTAKYNVIQCPASFFIDAQGIIRDSEHYPSALKSVSQIEGILNSMQ